MKLVLVVVVGLMVLMVVGDSIEWLAAHPAFVYIVPLGLIAGLVCLGLYFLFVVAPKARAEEERQSETLRVWLQERVRQQQEQQQEQMNSLALTRRRCGELAPPIAGTKNRYRCDGCSNQFAGAVHDISPLRLGGE